MPATPKNPLLFSFCPVHAPFILSWAPFRSSEPSEYCFKTALVSIGVIENDSVAAEHPDDLGQVLA